MSIKVTRYIEINKKLIICSYITFKCDIVDFLIKFKRMIILNLIVIKKENIVCLSLGQ